MGFSRPEKQFSWENFEIQFFVGEKYKFRTFPPAIRLTSISQQMPQKKNNFHLKQYSRNDRTVRIEQLCPISDSPV